MFESASLAILALTQSLRVHALRLTFSRAAQSIRYGCPAYCKDTLGLTALQHDVLSE